jgi:hypothetical protein
MVDKINGKGNLHKTIRANIHREHFYLAKEAPMCSGPFRVAIGYNSVSPTATAILEGKYVCSQKFALGPLTNLEMKQSMLVLKKV